MQETPMTAQTARAIAQYVAGEGQPSFAKGMPQGGDVALVLKGGGGVEILSVLPENPDARTLEDLGMRGTVALALFALIQNEDLMTQVLAETINRVEVTPPLAN